MVAFRLPALAVLAVVLLPAAAPADEPLRAVIDTELKAAWQKEGITPAPAATDSAFLRRIYLDLVGTIPTTEETTAFLANADPKKREKLIDQLLADPRFATAQADIWDLTLFGRHPGNAEAVRKRDSFRVWLAKQFADNAPYDVWVRDLLLAEKPGSGMFYVQFRNQPEEAATAVSRLFLGTQLQCAHCHDHPFDKWSQKDFFGLTGFFVRLVVEESGSGANRTFTIGEKMTGEVLFTGPVQDQVPGKKGEPVRPRFLGGADLDEPPAPKGMKEATPKAGQKLPKPPFSRKAKLAEWVTAKDNPYLAKAVANRIWAQFMGRGLIHPIDDIREESQPSHPALLKALTDSLTAHEFDLKWLIREIVSSSAYQLGQSSANHEALPKWFERARVRPLSAEELMASLRTATNYDADGKRNAKLPNNADEYLLRAFGEPTNGLGEFQGSLSEHLFLNNSEQLRMFARRKKGNLTDTLVTSTDSPQKKVERSYLSILNRPPTATEAERIVKYLAGKDKPEALTEDVVWVLLNSSEFRFNH